MLKRLCTGFLAFATVVTALPSTAVFASDTQYWTESDERVGIVEKVMNAGSIAYCIDINTDFKNGYKTRADASSRMSADQIADVALSIEYVKQYANTRTLRTTDRRCLSQSVSSKFIRRLRTKTAKKRLKLEKM